MLFRSGQERVVVPLIANQSRQKYRVSLAELHAVCEANYRRFMRAFPDYERTNETVLLLDQARVVISVMERNRYTTTFKVLQLMAPDYQWTRSMELELRAYHDAQMLEVLAFQRHRRIKPRYPYPNEPMFQKDEKQQQNQFVADWLEYLLAHARSSQILPVCGPDYPGESHD